MKERNLIIFCIFLIIFLFYHCSNQSKSRSEDESKITLLCWRNTEQNVFRDGRSTAYLVFIPLAYEDEEGYPQPGLLESWDHSEDYTEWTFHLRKNIKWHDGKPVTARDVKFTIELITDPHLQYEVKLFNKITIIDNYTCHLRSKRPFYALNYGWTGVFPEHLLGDLDKSEFWYWEFWKQPVGNGPYRYVRHVPDTMVELEANPSYYKEKPKIEHVILKLGGNPLTELLSGNVDAAIDLRPYEILQLAKDSRFNLYHKFNVTEVFSIIWNNKSPLFENPSVRRALTLAINRKELTQLLNFPEDTPIFDVGITPGHLNRGEVPAPLPFDPEQAKRLLDEAGWVEANKGGIREKNGHKFRFSLFFSAELMPGAIYIQDQLRRVGIDMETVTMELGVSVGRVQDGKFEAIFRSFNPFSYGWGYGGYDNPEFESLQKSVFFTTSHEELDRIAQNLWPIFQTDIPWTFLYPRVIFNVAHKRIQGLKSPYRSDPGKYLEHLWIEEE
jgi:peptide/nickel transport system substrate-binding protein